MKTASAGQKRVIKLLKNRGIIRPRELDAFKIPRELLLRLCQSGLVQRIGHGLYRLPIPPISEHYTLAEVCKSVPAGVVCLLSALRFHGLTTQAPHEVWIAVDNKGYVPKTMLPVRFVHFSGPALIDGVVVHKVEGVKIKIYCPAKTVADCFKYRNKIGLDVALEALREYQRTGKGSIDELWHYAKICRVAVVMRPYLEAMAI
jgi:predicted transcriptional regulator of viral defense system